VLPEGSYRPPVFSAVPSNPPHAILTVPVHTAVWERRAAGTFAPVEVAVQVFNAGE